MLRTDLDFAALRDGGHGHHHRHTGKVTTCPARVLPRPDQRGAVQGVWRANPATAGLCLSAA